MKANALEDGVGLIQPTQDQSVLFKTASQVQDERAGNKDNEAPRIIPLNNKSSKTIVLKDFLFVCLFVYPMEESKKNRLSCQDSKLESLDRLQKSKAWTSFALC